MEFGFNPGAMPWLWLVGAAPQPARTRARAPTPAAAQLRNRDFIVAQKPLSSFKCRDPGGVAPTTVGYVVVDTPKPIPSAGSAVTRPLWFRSRTHPSCFVWECLQ